MLANDSVVPTVSIFLDEEKNSNLVEVGSLF